MGFSFLLAGDIFKAFSCFGVFHDFSLKEVCGIFLKAILASQYYCLLHEDSLGGGHMSLQDRGNACVFFSVYYEKRVLKAWIVLVSTTKLVAYEAVILL